MPIQPIPPAQPKPIEQLPHALTFFLTTDERRRVLAELKRHHRDRRAALLKALRIESNPNRTIHTTPSGERGNP